MNVQGGQATRTVRWAQTLTTEYPAAGEAGRYSVADARAPRLPPDGPVMNAWFQAVMSGLHGRCSDATAFAIADALLLRLCCAGNAGPAELELDLAGLRRSEIALLRTIVDRMGGEVRWSAMSGTRQGVSRITSLRLDASIRPILDADDIAVASVERLDWQDGTGAQPELAEALAAFALEQARAGGGRAVMELIRQLVHDRREGALAIVMDGLAQSGDLSGMMAIVDAVLRLPDSELEPVGRLALLLAPGSPSDEPSAQHGPGQPFLSRLCSRHHGGADPDTYVVAFAYLSQILRAPHLSNEDKEAVCLSLHWDGNPYDGPLRKDTEAQLTAAEVAANEGRQWLAAAILHAIVESPLPADTTAGFLQSRLGIDAGAVLQGAGAALARVEGDSEALRFAKEGVRKAWASCTRLGQEAWQAVRDEALNRYQPAGRERPADPRELQAWHERRVAAANAAWFPSRVT